MLEYIKKRERKEMLTRQILISRKIAILGKSEVLCD